MQVDSIALVANQAQTFMSPYKFFMLIETGGPLRVKFFKNQSPTREIANDVEVGYISKPGDWRDAEDRFDGFQLLSTSNQTVRVGLSDREGDYRFALSFVRFEQPNSIDTVDDVTVDNTATVLVPADTSRRKAIITNISANAMRLGDANVGATSGARIGAGQSVTLDTTAAVYGIREGGSDAECAITVEART